MAESHTNRFRAHRNYVESFSWLAGRPNLISTDRALENLAKIIASGGLVTDKPTTSINLPQVKKSLKNAWSTEVLLALPGKWVDELDDFIRMSNVWGVVQAYYVGYHVTQALVIAKGLPRPTSHTTTQRLFAANWADRSHSLAPWTFGCIDGGWRNLPPGVVLDPTINPWMSCTDDTVWSLAAKALETTRKSAVNEAIQRKRDDGRKLRRDQWRAQEADRLSRGRRPSNEPEFARPQLTASEIGACRAGVRTFTVLDYLYRLRIGANYDDAAIYIEGPESDSEAFMFNNRLTHLVSATALATEARIANLIGLSTFIGWADEFIAGSVPPHYEVGIMARRKYF